MQQTNKYELNLIESSDAFLPAPLNENMQKVETALSKAETARANTEKKLDQRIAVLEAHRIITGYDGANSDSINLGVTPKAVIVCGTKKADIAIEGRSGFGATLKEGGFTYGVSVGPCTYMAII